MGNAHSGCTCCEGAVKHKLGLFYDDFHIVPYPPKRSEPVDKGWRDGSSRKSRRSQRDKSTGPDKGSAPYERIFRHTQKKRDLSSPA